MFCSDMFSHIVRSRRQREIDRQIVASSALLSRSVCKSKDGLSREWKTLSKLCTPSLMTKHRNMFSEGSLSGYSQTRHLSQTLKY